MDLDLARRLHRPADSKILWLVLDGLGGLPHPDSGKSELETAHTPHLDALAAESALGLSMPVGYGITPGSGPGHLALFGYDPLQFDIGRGVLEATGIGFPLEPSDVAARGNFCTLNGDGTIRDRRAGRLPSEQSAAIVGRLRAIRIAGLEVFVEPVREHRFVLVLRGAGLSAAVSDTDPQAEGVAPLPSPRAGPAGAGDGGRGQRVRRAGRAADPRRAPGQRAGAARLFHHPGAAADGRGVGPQARELRHLPDGIAASRGWRA